MLAKAAGVSLRSVQRILEAHQLAPHRIRMFKRSTDPKFAEKLKDVVGLYVDPPAHAVVLSVDEKSQIQGLDRTQPGLPMKPGRAGTMTHDYKRHGTTTLFAALKSSTAPSSQQVHRHQSSAAFSYDRGSGPCGKSDPAIVDNYATHASNGRANGLRRIPSTLAHKVTHYEARSLWKRGSLSRISSNFRSLGRFSIEERALGLSGYRTWSTRPGVDPAQDRFLKAPSRLSPEA